MFSEQDQRIAFGLNLITTAEISFACLVSLMVLLITIYHLIYRQINREDKLILILCANIYSSILIYTVIFLSFNIQTILGDIYQTSFESSGCLLIGYIYCAVLCTLYMAFVNQAFFRLCRIVYSRYAWLQFSSLYIILPPIQLIMALILLCPIYVWHDIIYVPEEHYCFVPLSNIRGYFWLFLSIYGVPVMLLSLMYFRITVFIKKQVNNQTLVVRRQQDRDLSAIRRILMIVGLLLFLGMPSIVFLIMMFITGKEYPLSFRIICLSIGISMAGLSIAMVLTVVQLKNIIWKIFSRNPIVPLVSNVTGSVPTRVKNSTH